MSDISIRLDGLLLALVILAGGGIFAAVALIAALRTLLADTPGKRSWRIPSYSLGLVLAHVAAMMALIGYTDSNTSAPTGPDWIDWLAAPWLCFIVAGLVLLFLLRRPRGARADKD